MGLFTSCSWCFGEVDADAGGDRVRRFGGQKNLRMEVEDLRLKLFARLGQQRGRLNLSLQWHVQPTVIRPVEDVEVE